MCLHMDLPESMGLWGDHKPKENKMVIMHRIQSIYLLICHVHKFMINMNSFFFCYLSRKFKMRQTNKPSYIITEYLLNLDEFPLHVNCPPL